jgi:hypothetical protein
MSRILLTALLGVGFLTGCPAPGADTSGKSDVSTPLFKTQTSITLSLSGAVLRVAHVETALFKLEGDTEVPVPSTALAHDRADLPRAIPLTDLHGESTYRLKAQAYDASKQAVASGSADIVVANDTPPASQSLALSILEVPFAGSVSQP